MNVTETHRQIAEELRSEGWKTTPEGVAAIERGEIQYRYGAKVRVIPVLLEEAILGKLTDPEDNR